MVNKMLAFCFMFYFISSTLARSELKLAKCREQMMNATLLAKRMVNEVLTVFSRAKPIYDYWVVPSWQNTVTAFVVPLCTYIHSHEENNKEDQKGTKYDLNDIFSTCQIQNKYKSDRREAPTYCTFLLGYRNNTQTMYPGNVFNVDNFDPLCTYAFKYHGQNPYDHHDDHPPQEPESFCIEYSEEK
ncbi:uncharacterized protein LOC132939398 isoform X3 [Metopolophium dirhodum]|uniref:uncharacterized protein LOC132939398 isoform X3 n=1 Tax=Metopolophium dirhodum TaxID=44670 RepID=UPI00298F66F5|nr:uncharacterized protein LOC132939398 isoform X3 [Metopolophium dirhodum]